MRKTICHKKPRAHAQIAGGSTMFRQEEVFIGGWQEKTMEAMLKRRFEASVSRLPPLGAGRLEALAPGAFERKIEQSWQDIPRKPMRSQQLSQVWRCVLGSIREQADCLSREEHDLVERALILGGSAQIEDALELEAARALSLRLWASVGLVSGKPMIELETPILRPVAKAFARQEHERVRQRFDDFSEYLTGTLYRVGAVDDRQPQQLILRDVLGCGETDELRMQLARRYLWASCDCVDYSGGVMLLHPALADPHPLLRTCRRQPFALTLDGCAHPARIDILPEEIPLQQDLERAIAPALRDGCRAQDVARTLRFLCKQGAPLDAMEEVLQESLIVYVSAAMRGALANMYYMTPKWIECAERTALQ